MSSSSTMFCPAGLHHFSGSFTDSSYQLTLWRKKRTETQRQPDLAAVPQETLIFISSSHYQGFMSTGTSIYHSRQLWLTLRLDLTKHIWSQGKVCPLHQALSGFLPSCWVSLACPRVTFIPSLLGLWQPLAQTICLIDTENPGLSHRLLLPHYGLFV